MKRYLFVTVFLGLSVFTLMGQSLSLQYGDQEIVNDTVYITGDPSDDLMEWHLQVINITDKEIEVKVRKREILLIENTSNTFCWGSCFLPSVYVSPVPLKIAANSTDYNSFAGDYEPSGMEGTSIISYTFFNAADDTDSVMVTAFYQAGTSGLGGLRSGSKNISIYPNPASDYINVELPESSSGQYILKLYDMGGKVLKEVSLEGQENKHLISLAGVMAPGAVLVIISDEGILATKKLLITR